MRRSRFNLGYTEGKASERAKTQSSFILLDACLCARPLSIQSQLAPKLSHGNTGILCPQRRHAHVPLCLCPCICSFCQGVFAGEEDWLEVGIEPEFQLRLLLLLPRGGGLRFVGLVFRSCIGFKQGPIRILPQFVYTAFRLSFSRYCSTSGTLTL